MKVTINEQKIINICETELSIWLFPGIIFRLILIWLKKVFLWILLIFSNSLGLFPLVVQIPIDLRGKFFIDVFLVPIIPIL